MMKMTKLFGISAAALGLTLACAVPASANLLVNPGFETAPFVDDGSGVGKWQPFGGTGIGLPSLSAIDMTMPLSGDYNAHLQLDNIANSFAGLFQDVTVAAGDDIVFSGWTKDLGLDAGGAEVRIEWRGPDPLNPGGSIEVSRTANMVPVLVPNEYTFWSLSAQAPAGADTARVVYAIQSFGAGPNQNHLLDDLSVVPEPASLALLGLGGLAMLRRRS